ncbi:hypothetical protein [Streptomyces sp. NBC_01483]|uniref:hypothetical protein n=1 Tax=Streptomyces sp. NBC_01483 TaxID=2903883 RepID=UPI002E37C156|nr:hypothetical protein [Streptomyces sp. NBC_01483]
MVAAAADGELSCAVVAGDVRRLMALHDAGTLPDPRDGQIARLKAENDTLRDRIARQNATVEKLTAFKTLALSRIAAQHEEITRLRSTQPDPDAPPIARLTAVPGPGQTIDSSSRRTRESRAGRELLGERPGDAPCGVSPRPG